MHFVRAFERLLYTSNYNNNNNITFGEFMTFFTLIYAHILTLSRHAASHDIKGGDRCLWLHRALLHTGPQGSHARSTQCPQVSHQGGKLTAAGSSGTRRKLDHPGHARNTG